MEINPLNHGKLKIRLTKEELEKLGLCCETLDCKNAATRGLLLSLLKTAGKQADFSPESRVVIEVLSEKPGGCTVYFSAMDYPRPSRWRVLRCQAAPAVYAFAQVDDLISGAVKLFGRYAHRIGKSALYRLEGGWRLVLYPALNAPYTGSLALFDAFAPRCGQGPLAVAWLEEHARPVLREHALDLIASYFG